VIVGVRVLTDSETGSNIFVPAAKKGLGEGLPGGLSFFSPLLILLLPLLLALLALSHALPAFAVWTRHFSIPRAVPPLQDAPRVSGTGGSRASHTYNQS
jgi:hypothetical protein